MDENGDAVSRKHILPIFAEDTARLPSTTTPPSTSAGQPGLRGTWARACSLLTRLVSQIGWDELLKTRSNVFVMEEEYRMQKAQIEVKRTSLTINGVQPTESDVGQMIIHEDGTVRPSNADDNASTRTTASPILQNEESEPNGNTNSNIPTIRISSS